MEYKGQQQGYTRNKGKYEDNEDERQWQETMLNMRTAKMRDNNAQQ